VPRRKKDNQDKPNQGKPKRRARGEGTVVQHPDGRWIARIPLGGGKRKEEYYKTKPEAERAKRRMLNERDAGTLAVERDQTLKEYLIYWLEAHRATVRETTYSMYYTYITTRVIPVLGQVRLRKLTVEMFQALYQQWERERFSPNTIRLIHGILHEALQDAMSWKKLTYNPVKEVKLPKARKATIHILSDEEIIKLLQCAQKMRLYVLFRMALLLGLRIGELCGLKWSDFDQEKAVLQIQRTIYYMQDPDTGHQRFYEGPPKTEAGARTLHLPRDVVGLLQKHRERQEQIRASSPRWENLDLVFFTRTGNYLTPTHIRASFDILLRAAGIEHMKFHALRHNATLILRKLGIDPVVRKEILGHTSLDMTDGVYGHADQKMHKQASARNRSFIG
jgi:integrase